ncbi:MAG: hypothetical protein HN576_03025 [Bacteriovoracaceae bacterium]|jgi:hypothetical protein|nr:hypothetical protein [Bacteriovoracaceae bacterium]
MKLLLLGDSLGYPRPDRSILDEQTWNHLITKILKKNKPDLDVFCYFTGGAHSKELLSMRIGGYLAAYDPDIVVLQVGIVDCASRAMSENMLKVVSVIPFISRLVRMVIKKFHRQLLSIRNVHYVYPNEFRTNLVKLKESFSPAKFIVIPIAPVTEEYIEFMPRVGENVEKYNRILEEVFGDSFLKELYKNFPAKDIVLEDHHHLSILGHQLVSKSVKHFLESRNYLP